MVGAVCDVHPIISCFERPMELLQIELKHHRFKSEV